MLWWCLVGKASGDMFTPNRVACQPPLCRPHCRKVFSRALPCLYVYTPIAAVITICIPWAHLWRILEPLPLNGVLRLLPQPLLRVRAALLRPQTGRSAGLVLKFPAPPSPFTVGDPPRVPCCKKMAAFLLPEPAGCCCLRSDLATCR